MTTYVVRAALHEEANAGWVWLEHFPSRSLVKIKNGKTDQSVVCEVRRIDKNFLEKYNKAPRINIESSNHHQSVAMSQWYRDALGIPTTTDANNKTGTVDLSIEKCRFPVWADIRAACSHPDIVVRLGTRLGILGGVLGVVGLVPVVTSLIGFSSYWGNVWLLLISIFSLLVGWCACRGPKRAAVTSPESS